MDEHKKSTTTDDLINMLLSEGLGEGLPKVAEMILNAAMLIERARHIRAAPHQRVEHRNGHANGFKPRSFHTSLGELSLAIPQVRGSDSPFNTNYMVRVAKIK